jgi:hypothetical protein
MAELDAFELRLERALRRYASDARTDVDAPAFARLVMGAQPIGFGNLIVSPRVRFGLLVAAALLALVAAALFLGSDRRPLLGSGMVAFSSDGDVYLADEQGGGAVAAIRRSEPFSVQAWSSDGTWLAVQGGNVTYRLDPASLALTPLHETLGADPDASALVDIAPDGRSLLVSLAHPLFGARCCDLTLVDIDNGRERQLGSGEADGQGVCLPAWSPDGRHVAAVRPARVIVIEIATGIETAIGTWPRDLCRSVAWGTGWDAPTWSPDSDRVAFVGPHGSIVVARRDGTELSRLATETSHGPHPLWSPDGEWIAYRTRLGLALARPDWSESRILVPARVGEYEVIADPRWIAWASDGSRIDFAREPIDPEHDAFELWTVDVATGATERIDTGGRIESFARQPVVAPP